MGKNKCCNKWKEKGKFCKNCPLRKSNPDFVLKNENKKKPEKKKKKK